ncbi:MAG: M56 family metallopeptidase [Prevotella sp.]|nr:M56 family metallopeptidase [Prevotella sp.]
MMVLTDLIYYDLKVAALIAVFYLFYMLLLARETTHTLNRAVLLGGIVLSAVLPLCVVTIHKTLSLPLPVREGSIYPLSGMAADDVTTPLPHREGLGEGLLLGLVAAILLAGILIRLLYVAHGYWKLHQLIRNGEQHTLTSGSRVCVVDAPVAPFSWMRTIVLSRADWSATVVGRSALPLGLSKNASERYDPLQRLEALPTIFAHEEAHVRHRHSYDIVVVEVLTALQWFNPVVWFLRQELRTLHEYEADASVLSRGFNESQYIHLLMQKATGIQACALANGINTYKTKKRIIMMLKPKSKRAAWLKALYIVPVALVSLAMTARTVVDYQTATTEDNAAVRLFHENTNGRGDSYQICHTPDVKFYNNGKEEAIPGDRSLALEVSKTTMQIDGVKFDEGSLPDLPVTALREIHLNETSPDRFVCNLVTVKPMRYSPKMSDTDFVNYVKRQKAAGIDENALGQIMLNEGGSISRAHILHTIRAYGSKKNNFFVIDGKEVSPEEFELLQPEDIASVTVMDVGPAKKVFGDKGRYGATVVETVLQRSEALPTKVDEPIFDVCEQMPSFPGGEAELMGFIAKNIKYPEIAMKYGVQGRVLVQFIVEKDGSLSNTKILENPKKSGANMVVVTAMMPEKERQDAEGHNAGVQAMRDEAIRVVNAMPRWSPGKQNGNVVRCNFVIPVTYRLQ